MKDSQEEAQRWLRQAENDLGFAAVAIREGYFAQACFIAQQVAEKALQAIRYGRGERIVLGHSVVDLVHGVGDLGSSPSGADETKELERIAGILDQYYVPTRYPNGLPGGVPFEAFGRDQAVAAVDGATRFVDLAREQLGG